MKPWSDLFLALPLPEGVLRVLLFVGFGLHLLFVLLMLGTAMLGLFAFLEAWLVEDPARQPWNKRVLGSHLALKSLAVVLGVAPLLVIQVYNSEAFFTATGLFSYAWLAVIPLLIVAFLAVDGFGHKLEGKPIAALALGVIGLGALLTVPAVFTGALALMERPGLWGAAAAHGPAATPAFVAHWSFRYLHVLGAAVVFGGVFHLVFTAGKDLERKAKLRRWTFAAMLFQVVAGAVLLGTLDGPIGGPALAAITVGMIAAMAALWLLRAPDAPDGDVAGTASGAPARGRLLILLPVLFVAMLAGRQLLQDSELEPQRAAALAERANRAVALAANQPAAMAEFTAKLNTVYDNGRTIYAGSCQPCHGADGTGDGPAARRLLIPAEDLSAIRAERAYVRELLEYGVPGSAMPYFTVFDRAKLESLLTELDSRFSMLAGPVKPSGEAGAEARKVWAETCATCHGELGAVSAFGKTLKPAPPDLTRYALTPQRSFTVITDGYPGTVMQPYRALPESVRHELVDICQGLRVR